MSPRVAELDKLHLSSRPASTPVPLQQATQCGEGALQCFGSTLNPTNQGFARQQPTQKWEEANHATQATQATDPSNCFVSSTEYAWLSTSPTACDAGSHTKTSAKCTLKRRSDQCRWCEENPHKHMNADFFLAIKLKICSNKRIVSLSLSL
jgi:hypothetical protein